MWKFHNLIDADECAAAANYLGVEVEYPAVLLAAAASSLTSRNKSSHPTDTDVSATGDDNHVDVPSLSNPMAASSSDGLGLPPDVLVRRVVGVDVDTGAIAVSGPPVRLGAFVRFQVRNAQSCAAELDSLRKLVPTGAIGGLLLTDTGRAEMTADAAIADVEAFGTSATQVARLLGSAQIGPLPAPGYQQFFPIRNPGAAASSFQHMSSAVYLLVFEEGASYDGTS
jgi:hypothetical protein